MVTADESVPLYQQMIYARNTLKDQLSTIAGVGDVTLAGYVEPNLRVWLDAEKMKHYELTSTDILSAIQAEQIEQPAGRIEAPKNEMNIRVFGEAKSPEDFGKIRINTRGGAANYNPIPLNKVARIEEGISDLRAISRYNGKTAVGLGIVKQHGSNAVEVSKLVYKKVDLLRPTLFPGYHMEIKLDQTKFIKESVSELNMTLDHFGYFNVDRLLSVPGILVLDDQRPVCNSDFDRRCVHRPVFLWLHAEHVHSSRPQLGDRDRRRRRDHDAGKHRPALRNGKNKAPSRARRLRSKLLLPLSQRRSRSRRSFIPVIFMQGMIGRFFYQYGVTVTVAVFFRSWKLSRSRRCAARASCIRPNIRTQAGCSRPWIISWIGFRKSTKRSLQWCLRHRWTIVTLSLIFFATSLIFVSTLRKELVPAQDQSLFLVTIKTPSWKLDPGDGRDLQKGGRVSQKLNPKLRIITPRSETTRTTTSSTPGSIYVILKDPKNENCPNNKSWIEPVQSCERFFRTPKSSMQDLSLTGFSASRGFPIEYTLEGPDWEQARSVTPKPIVDKAQTDRSRRRHQLGLSRGNA